jgi:hypothetical protein
MAIDLLRIGLSLGSEIWAKEKMLFGLKFGEFALKILMLESKGEEVQVMNLDQISLAEEALRWVAQAVSRASAHTSCY